MKINCIIIDDEPLAVELIESYVSKTPFLELKGSFYSGIAALEAIRQTPVDLIFCDIQMPELNGMELSRMLPEHTRVVFTTAFDQYALEGFRVNAMDYLLKPIKYSDFLASANRAVTWFSMQDQSPLLPVTPQIASENQIQSIFVKSDYQLRQIELDKILYIEGLKDYVKIYVEGESKPIISLLSLKSMEQQLPSESFMRIHRSFIVQLPKVKIIERNRIVFGNNYIPISDSCRELFYQKLSTRSLFAGE